MAKNYTVIFEGVKKVVLEEGGTPSPGPIVETFGGKGLSVKLSYLNEFRLVEQFMAMNKA